MKKQIIGTLLLSAMVLGVANTTLAANDTAKSKGVVEFETSNDNDGNVIIPKEDPNNPDEEIDPEIPIPPVVVDDVVLKYVPSFNFGTNNISTSAKSYSALYDSVKDKEADGQTTPNEFYSVPHFAQVHDRSGVLDTKWALTVMQDGEFKHATTATSTLSNATIDLYGKTLTTNNGKSAANILEGLTIASGASVSIPNTKTAGAGALELMKSTPDGTAEKSTNGVHSSIVFENDYKKENYGATKTQSDRTDSVKLHVPQQAGILKGVYKTDLVWDLTVTP